ncbi:MAG: Rrf2 family transcriptional regulator [Pseudomonadota bacterium]
MKISTRSRYALRAMLELALRKGDGPVLMQDIADEQEVSRKYLDAIFTSLKATGLVRSKRGVGGGYLLAKDPTQIKIGDILRALEGPISLVDCVGDDTLCSRSKVCVTREIWDEIGQAIERILDDMTLADLVDKHRKSVSRQ